MPTTATTTASASRSSPASPAWPSRASRSTPGDGILSKFDTKTYESTPIGDTGKVTTWITGGKIDPATGAFLYSVKNDTEAALYSVDLQTAAATKLFDLENEEQLGGFYIPETAPADNVPAPVTSIGTTFSGTNLTGKVRFQMPRTLQDGTAAEGPLTYHIYANGQLISSGESTFGASGTQQIEVTVPAADTYSFAVTAENENGESKRVRASKIFVGPDTPKATTRVQVTDYKDGQVTLSWASVSNGLHGGNIDRNNLRYRVTRYPDGVVVSSDNLATYRMTDALPVPAERTEYYYTVEAVCGDLVSPATASPTFALGPITPAESIEFTSKANTFGWTALNPGTDTKAWSFYSAHVEVETNAKPADSWFVSPAINVKAGNTYEITLNMSAYSSRYTETFELMAGTAADAASLTEAVIHATDITSTTYAPFTGSYTATADGQIYLGIHATSANGYTLRLKGVSISEGVSTLAPAAVSDLQAAAGENGAHTATLTFTLPTLNLGGNALESITSVELQRNGETVKTVTEGLTPGAQHLCSMYVMRGSSMIQSDDWAITPELTGKPQIVTLWASSFQADPDQTQYYETFQMLYSTTGTEPEDFTLIEEVRNVAPQWKQYSVYVPEGARYFAVRSVSYDAYMLFVDDVTFKAADGATAAAEICGYNVYRDSQLISAEPVEETAFADENAQKGKTYTYAVTTVYNDGESAPSNLAIIDTTNLGINGVYGSEAVNIRAIDGSIEVLGAAGKMVTVVTPAGAVLYSAPGAARVEIPVARGLYLVTVGITTAKLAVE